jgi:hypothetical protein
MLGGTKMYRFHGDLLMGGIALRHLEGTLEDRPRHGANLPAGRFRVDPSKEELFELGRPYLLMLEDGRSERVIVTEMHEDESRAAVVCRFRAESWDAES